MVVDKLVVEVGSVATAAVTTINFSDEPALPKLQELQVVYPGRQIYLSGAIAIDFPEEVNMPIDPKAYPTVVLAGDRLTLEYHPLDRAVVVLREQYVVGTVQVKVQ